MNLLNQTVYHDVLDKLGESTIPIERSKLFRMADRQVLTPCQDRLWSGLERLILMDLNEYTTKEKYDRIR